MFRILIAVLLFSLTTPVQSQEVIPLDREDIGGLHAVYVVPRDDFNRVDVQVIVLSGSYDDTPPTGTAHLLEHYAAFHADTYVLRKPRERDLFAKTGQVSTVYTNSGAPNEIDRLMKLSRALLDTPTLSREFMEGEIDIVKREVLLRERRSPFRWLVRENLQALYGQKWGRANNLIGDMDDLTVDIALDFHAAHYVPSNITLLISGKIDKATAAAKVREYFGDTERTPPPPKPWLDIKPAVDHRVVNRISSPRLVDDTLVYSKFVDPDWLEDSSTIQGDFFIASELFNTRLERRMEFEDFMIKSLSTLMFVARNGDTEITVRVVPMPGQSFEAVHEKLEHTIATLLDEPLTHDEIEAARARDAAWARTALRRPQMFLDFLENVASDGLPPISPGVFAQMIEDVSDADVERFLRLLISPSATATLYASRED